MRGHRGLILSAFAAGLVLAAGAALAQSAHNPFAVAGNEGSASPAGIGGWILAQQSYFYRLLTGALRAARQSGAAMWTLAGIGFAYGVLHAAGPGHGKAVVASYMLANERALRRGLVISFAAAALQGLVAIALVGTAAYLLHVTAQYITRAADWIDIACFGGIAVLGAWLVWRKGQALVAAMRTLPSGLATALLGGPDPAFAGAVAGGFRCESVEEGHVHDASCGHFHMPDPAILGDGFSWRTALLTVFSAGARPCSGAILVLVFAVAQGFFLAGVWTTLAMALGTAITTAGLAITAVLMKGLAAKLVGRNSRHGEIVARGVELLAALCVLGFGLALFFGVMQMGA